jgi:hypothetical protein
LVCNTADHGTRNWFSSLKHARSVPTRNNSLFQLVNWVS